MTLLAGVVVGPVLAPSSAGPGTGSVARAADGVWAQVPDSAEVASVTLTQVSPAAAGGDDVLRLSGVLTNTSDSPIVDPVPALRWSADPLQSVAEIDLVAENPLFRYGQVDYRFSDTLDTVDPGERTRFVLEVPLDDLAIGRGVFVVGVDVLAGLPDGLRVFVADDRTTVPVDVEADDPLPVAMLWPLAAKPSLLPDGRLVDDDLAGQVAPGGRLDNLLRSAGGSEATWVVDPDLVASLSAMADGYETVAGGETDEGSAAATRYLADLGDTLGQAADVRAMPMADPDVGGALASGIAGPAIEATLIDAATDPAVSDLAGRAVAPVALLGDRPVTNRMLGIYSRAGIATSVLSPDSVEPGSAQGRTRVSREKRRNVPAVIARVPPTDGVGGRSELTTRQWLLSTTAVQATTAGGPSVMVVGPSARWTPSAAAAQALLSAWRSTQWVEPVTMAGLPGPAEGQETVALVDGAQPSPLPDGIATGLAEVVEDAERLQPLFAEPVLGSDEIPAVTARATSYAWQADPEAGLQYLDALASGVVDAEQQIELVVSPSITLASRSGRFPITLVNGASVDVVVGVDFTSQNSTRLRVENIEPVVLTAGEKRTFTATALATANGRLQVTARLVTSEGSQVGAPATTIVDVTNVGALGWTVIGLGGVLMVAAIARSRWRSRRSPAAPTGDE